MSLSRLDIAIVAGYVALSLAVGLLLSRRATRSIDDYFVAGRSLPWWLAGVSMVASAFSIDTPLGITGMVAKDGVQGVWFAWAFAIGGAGTFGAFVFAAMLRRSEIITTAELVELRYSGRGAAILRGFKGVYFGVLSLSISMGWVIGSVLVLAQEALGWDALPTLAAILAVTIAYTAASGMFGVAATDFMQFFLGSAGSLALAYKAVAHVGGLGGLMAGLEARYGAALAAERLHFLPRPGSSFFPTFLVMVTLKWWGNPPAAINQRIMSTRDERDATFSTLLFAAGQFAVNYWPMILTALAALVAYPDLARDLGDRGRVAAEAQQAYARLMIEVMPPGLLGLLLASLVAAFMSTIDTQANSGAAFMVNDIYRRFVAPRASRAHLVRVSQISTVVMLLLAVLAAYFQRSVATAWEYLATLIAGYGFVVVARWFWWRVNAWAELAALVGSGVGSVLANHVLHLGSFGARFLLAAGLSVGAWIAVSLVTPPSSMAQLEIFCRKVKPYPLFWGPVRRAFPDIPWNHDLPRNLLLWLVGMAGVFGLCFGIGHALLGSPLWAGLLFTLATLALAGLLRYWRP